MWIAGGQLKGAPVDDLVRESRRSSAGVVLLGVDRGRSAPRLARHAPDVPVIEVATDDDGAMTEVVQAAAGLARPGDTVLLAPAAASYDMFAGYAARGDRVRRRRPAALGPRVTRCSRLPLGPLPGRADRSARVEAPGVTSTVPMPRSSCCCSPASVCSASAC